MLDQEPLRLPRSAEPPAGRADQASPRHSGGQAHAGRTRAARHPPDHQRRRGRLTQYGIKLAETRMPAFAGILVFSTGGITLQQTIIPE